MSEVSSFEQLVSECEPMLRAMASSYPERYREDLIQEGRVGLHNAYLTFDPSVGAPFGVYIRICVKNSMITAYKRLSKDMVLSPLDDNCIISDAVSMEDKIINKRDTEVFFEKLKKSLTPFEKQVLAEYLKDISYEDIAKNLSKPKKSVDNALSRIRKKMKEVV